MDAAKLVWSRPPSRLSLGPDEVHVWRVSLDPPAASVEQLAASLSADELIRAERFLFERHRRRFIVGRGILRAILSRYVSLPPNHLRFCYGPYGKPELDDAHGGEALRFNLSHSHELALCAVAHGRMIGVDLEWAGRPVPDVESIARQFFAAAEIASLLALPKQLKRAAFLNCWTRKEAYSKGRGGGLSIPLNQFEVSLVPGEPAALLSSGYDSEGADCWSLQALAPGPGYIAAVAVQGRGWRLRCWDWETSR